MDDLPEKGKSRQGARELVQIRVWFGRAADNGLVKGARRRLQS